MELKEMKTITMTEKGQITIPRQVREISKLKKGKKMVILAFADHVELRPMKQVSEGMISALMSEKSFAKDWNTKEEDKAWKHL